ncbi:hypothetical protein AVEN_142399-1 [Araneus ventricosus]|uniref:Uncharacterized protein n=1 Tax=Araneus ventricosus TaxID=182803 RepID=A0A4Y2FDM9_ARAVE|nr:hypothetical protein AVEN_142399-1 [Araneus ventricosus]
MRWTGHHIRKPTEGTLVKIFLARPVRKLLQKDLKFNGLTVLIGILIVLDQSIGEMSVKIGQEGINTLTRSGPTLSSHGNYDDDEIHEDRILKKILFWTRRGLNPKIRQNLDVDVIDDCNSRIQ